MIRIARVLFVLTLIAVAGCATPRLGEYRAANADETAVVKTLLDLQAAANRYEWRAYYAMFSPTGKFYGVPVREWYGQNQEKMEKFEAYECSMYFSEPRRLVVKPQTAHVELLRTVECADDASTWFVDLKKINAQWKITEVNRR